MKTHYIEAYIGGTRIPNALLASPLLEESSPVLCSPLAAAVCSSSPMH